MTKRMTDMVASTYESPICEVVDINAEGVLCSSFETPEDYDKGYEW